MRFLSTKAPSLHRSYPASAVLRASPPSQSARPISHEPPVDLRSPLGLPVLCMVPFACMPSPIPRQDRWKLVRSYDSINFGLPRNRGGSAPALVFSRPAQRSLTLRPARSPSHLCDLLHQRLQQSRCLPCCSDCYRVERTSSRAGYSRSGPSPFHGAPDLSGPREV